MKFQDYYNILGISKDASQDEIKRAYRKLARKYHPDVNKTKGAEKKFIKVNEANEVLKDPEKRKLYDTYGENWQQAGFEQPPNWTHDSTWKTGQEPFRENFSTNNHSSFEEEAGFSDFFRSLFGNDFTDNRDGQYAFNIPGRSQEAEITVSLADVCHGATRTISFQTFEADGNGQIKPASKMLRVKIPKGVTNGSVIRLAGQGEMGSGQQNTGDLLLKINISPDPYFTIKGHDLYTVISVSPWEAALGAKIPIQSIDGKVNLVIPKGSQNGKKLRLRGKGIPRRKGAPGDIIVELDIIIPEQMTPEEEQLFEHLSQKSTFNPREIKNQRAGYHGKI